MCDGWMERFRAESVARCEAEGSWRGETAVGRPNEGNGGGYGIQSAGRIGPLGRKRKSQARHKNAQIRTKRADESIDEPVISPVAFGAFMSNTFKRHFHAAGPANRSVARWRAL